MLISTTRFGDIEIQENDIIFLPEGLVGFPELKKYILLDHDVDSPFKWLQSIDDGNIAFVILSPLTFLPEYNIEVTEDDVACLKLEAVDDAIISTIITIPSDPNKMSANLKAPLIFNSKNRMCKQVILKENTFHTKHFIMEELKKNQRKDIKIQQQSTQEEILEKAS